MIKLRHLLEQATSGIGPKKANMGLTITDLVNELAVLSEFEQYRTQDRTFDETLYDNIPKAALIQAGFPDYQLDMIDDNTDSQEGELHYNADGTVGIILRV